METATATVPSAPSAPSKDKMSKALISRIAHANGVKISSEAKELYSKLPDKKSAEDMISHAAGLMKAVGRKSIPASIAKVEMAHYNKK